MDGVPFILPLTSFGSGSLNLTLGVGAYANIVLKEDPDYNGGVRIPIGVNLLMGGNVLEIFTHVAPSFGVSFLPQISLDKAFFPIAIGARIWFR
jgi:hypothetical protein